MNVWEMFVRFVKWTAEWAWGYAECFNLETRKLVFKVSSLQKTSTYTSYYNEIRFPVKCKKKLLTSRQPSTIPIFYFLFGEGGSVIRLIKHKYCSRIMSIVAMYAGYWKVLGENWANEGRVSGSFRVLIWWNERVRAKRCNAVDWGLLKRDSTRT